MAPIKNSLPNLALNSPGNIRKMPVPSIRTSQQTDAIQIIKDGTGSQPDGTAFAATEDRTCKNWTSSTQGSAIVGHSDRVGLRDDDASKSWNSSHPSRGPDGGCSQADLKSTGGDGLLYCFAAN